MKLCAAFVEQGYGWGEVEWCYLEVDGSPLSGVYVLVQAWSDALGIGIGSGQQIGGLATAYIEYCFLNIGHAKVYQTVPTQDQVNYWQLILNNILAKKTIVVGTVFFDIVAYDFRHDIDACVLDGLQINMLHPI